MTTTTSYTSGSKKYLVIINAGRIWTGGLKSMMLTSSSSASSPPPPPLGEPPTTLAAMTPQQSEVQQEDTTTTNNNNNKKENSSNDDNDGLLVYGNRIVDVYPSSQLIQWMKEGSAPSPPDVESSTCSNSTKEWLKKVVASQQLPPLAEENISEVIDLQGKGFVSPGFVDAHLHFLDSGRQGLQVLLDGASSKEHFQQLVVDQVAEIKKKAVAADDDGSGADDGADGPSPIGKSGVPWIYGRGWLEADLGLPVGETPTIEWIDDLPGCQGVPLVLKRNCVHSALVNSLVLKLCGIDKDTPDPEGGRIERFPDGRPNGILREGALKALKSLRPSLDTVPNLYFALDEAQKVLFEQGVTQAHHMSTLDFYTPAELRFLMKADSEKKLKIRLAAATKLGEAEEAVSIWKENQARLKCEIEPQDSEEKEEEQQQTDSSLLSFGMVKCFLDGALGSKTLAMIPHDEFNAVPENTKAMAEELKRKRERERQKRKKMQQQQQRDEFDDDDETDGNQKEEETSSPPLSPEIKGLMMAEWPDLIKQQCVYADENGLQMCFHAIGDAAVRACVEISDHCDEMMAKKQEEVHGNALGAFLLEDANNTDPPEATTGRRMLRSEPSSDVVVGKKSDESTTQPDQKRKKDRRIRIEHCQNVAPSDRSKLAERGMIASMQPLQLIGDTKDSDCMLGVDRSAASAYAFRSLLLDNKIPVAFGSDWMVCFPSVLKSLYTAVLRKGVSADGLSEERWNIDQALTAEQALLCHTYWASFAAFNEHRTGTIEPGFLADLTILEEDPLITLEAIRREADFDLLCGTRKNKGTLDDSPQEEETEKKSSLLPGGSSAKDFEDFCRVKTTIVDGQIQFKAIST